MDPDIQVTDDGDGRFTITVEAGRMSTTWSAEYPNEAAAQEAAEEEAERVVDCAEEAGAEEVEVE